MIPALQQAAFDPRMRGQVLQVYLCLSAELDVHQYRPLKITALARLMGLHLPHLSRHIARLVASGYLDVQPDPDDGRRELYRLVYSVPPWTRSASAA